MLTEQQMRLKMKMRMKKPYFRRHNSWKHKRVKESWRRPRGIDNKMRMKLKGWGKWPEIGYKKPDEIRFYHPCGKKEVLVYNVKDLEGIDPNEYVIRVAATVGYRKYLQIEEKATELGLTILNRRRPPGEALIPTLLGGEEIEETEEEETEETTEEVSE